MLILRSLLIVIEIICSLLLVGLVLIQKSKSEGLGLAFGSGMGESLFGSRAGNILTKLTVIFTVIFLSNTLILGKIFAGSKDASILDGGIPPTAEVEQAPIVPSSDVPVASDSVRIPPLPSTDFQEPSDAESLVEDSNEETTEQFDVVKDPSSTDSLSESGVVLDPIALDSKSIEVKEVDVPIESTQPE